MTAHLALALALLAIVLVGSARLCWPRGAAARGGVTMALLLVLQLASATLLYFTLLPPHVPVAAGELTVLTAAADAARHAPSPAANTIALPEATAAAGIATAPDLATALRQHPGTRSLQVVGDGLPARDRDTALPAEVRWQPSAPPRGWVALTPPAPTAPGSSFAVQARAQGVANGSAELLDPAGQVVDRRPLAADGNVQLEGVARASGRSVFQVRLLDAGRHAVDTSPVPLQTLEQPAPRVLILGGAPGPELKYLRRWAADTGLAVHAQASAGGGVSLGDAPLALTAASLAATDVLILDERSLAGLGAAQRGLVQQALHDGLGVVVRSTGPLGEGARQALQRWGLAASGTSSTTPLRLPADPDPALLQARRGPSRAAVPPTAAIDAADRASHAADVPVLAQFALRAADTTPLLHDAAGQAVGGWRRVGRGRLALLPVTDSYRLVLAGREDRHAELWSAVLAHLARPVPAAPAARLDTATPWAGERVALCGVAEGAQVDDAAGAAVPLRIDPATGSAACAAYWPAQAGWHQLRQGTQTQAFYVYAPDQARAMHRQQLREAMAQQALEGAGTAQAREASRPGPRWPWWLAFLGVAGLLWWLERRRPPVRPAP
ncbi:hypothetical protein [Stenotrophomonas sp.]|uniref:hypothetical protein n=1 Tax=Stenotrophomonas sp. TaxID=69392 RepID=UPI002FC9F3AD